jgi:hypothetical protein
MTSSLPFVPSMNVAKKRTGRKRQLPMRNRAQAQVRCDVPFSVLSYFHHSPSFSEARAWPYANTQHAIGDYAGTVKIYTQVHFITGAVPSSRCLRCHFNRHYAGANPSGRRAILNLVCCPLGGLVRTCFSSSAKSTSRLCYRSRILVCTDGTRGAKTAGNGMRPRWVIAVTAPYHRSVRSLRM